ncbi:hypothetical protein SSX86_022946 [Deinandra increscens subsp. villosa]|uniref:Uncharacterized protein n=1 Tax=Deinandra increscens subsp. villosa TaxID=3103831 RepID=A0AAP0CJY9_9ASTR
MSIYNHRLGRGGYARLEQKLVESKVIDAGTMPSRSLLWYKARENKAGEIEDEAAKAIAAEIMKTEKKITNGQLKLDPGNDAMIVVLGKEKCGSLRGVGTGVNPSKFFNVPRQRGSMRQQMDVLQAQLEKEKQENVEKDEQINALNEKMAENEKKFLYAQEELQKYKAGNDQVRSWQQALSRNLQVMLTKYQKMMDQNTWLWTKRLHRSQSTQTVNLTMKQRSKGISELDSAQQAKSNFSEAGVTNYPRFSLVDEDEDDDDHDEEDEDTAEDDDMFEVSYRGDRVMDDVNDADDNDDAIMRSQDNDGQDDEYEVHGDHGNDDFENKADVSVQDDVGQGDEYVGDDEFENGDDVLLQEQLERPELEKAIRKVFNSSQLFFN